MRKVIYTTELEIGAKETSGFKNSVKGAALELDRLDKTAKKSGKGVMSCSETLDRLDKGATKVAKAMLATGAAVTAGAVVAIKNATETYKGFEQEMATVAGITKASASEYAQLKEAALDAGSKTVYTAQEAASGLEYMSLAGWDVQKSTQALMPVLRMATATGKELGTTSDLITDSMGALKVGVGGLTGYMDKLISANNYSNTTAEQLMQALIKTGGAARTVGADLDDTITGLGILANNGTKAEEAGVGMNSMLTRIVSNSTAVKTLNRIGVSIWDAQGKFIGLKNTLIEINDAMANMTDEDKATTIAGIAGVHRYSQMSYLLNSVKVNAKTGVSAWDDLESHISNSNGALNQMYATTTNTFENAEKMLESAKEDMQIRITDVFADDARDFIKWLAESLPNATADLVDFAQAYQSDFADLIEGTEDGMQKAWEAGFNAFTWIVENHDTVGGALKGIAEGIIAIKVANNGLKLAKTVSELAELGGGLGGVTLGITGVVSAALVAGNAIKGAIEDAERQAVDSDLESHFGNISLTLDEIDDISKDIIGKDTIDGVNALNDAISQSDSSFDSVNKSLEETRKSSWKINVGYKMTKDDYSSYGSEIQSYIKNAEKYAESRGYEMHLSTALLFGDGTTQDTDLTNTFKSAQAQLTSYGNDLYDYLYNETNGALLDGAIDIDENKVVQELQEKMQKIIDDMADSKTQAQFDAIEMKYSGASLDADSFKQLQKDLRSQVSTTEKTASDAMTNAMQGYEYKKKIDSSYTDAQFEADKQAVQEAYNKKVTEANRKATQYMLKSIEDAYPGLNDTITQLAAKNKEIIQKYTDMTNEETKSLWENNPGIAVNNMANELESAYDKSGLNKTDKKAVSKLLDGMQDEIDALETQARQYTAMGKEIPKSLQNTLESLRTAEGIAEGYDGISNGILSSLLTDEDFQRFVNNIDDEFSKSYLSVGQYAKNVYSKGYDINTDVRATLNTKTTVSGLGTVDDAMDKIQNYMQQKAAAASGIDVNGKLYSQIVNGPKKSKNVKIPGIAKNAKGGIYDRPLLTTFAEEGPEAAVPLDGSRRAKDLWIASGEMLGMVSRGRDRRLVGSFSGGKTKSAGGQVQQSGELKIIYSPSVTIKGNASREDVTKALAINKNELARMIKQINREEKRKSFGG